MVVSEMNVVKPRANIQKMNKSNKKPDKKILIIAQELKLAKILAGNNKSLRDRTLKRLKKWFDARDAQMPFNEDDFMRVWKGLFYYMWMSDKPLTQEQCANNISKLIDFKSEETSLLFFKCFLKTMVNEWFGIDYLRLDKFLMLVRRVLRQAMNVLSQSDWNSKLITIFQNILNQTVLNLDSNVPLGLSLHLVEIYLEELAKVSKGNIAKNQVLELIRPFASHLSYSKDTRQCKHIKTHIFTYLLRQSDAGIEYEARFKAWQQLGFPGGSIDAMEKVDIEEDKEDDLENQMENLQDEPLDPRAGKVHVELNQLKFDPIKIAEMLDELRFKPNTNIKSRKTLNGVADQFRRLAAGKYSSGLTKIKTKPKRQGPSTKLKSSLKRLENFERELLADSTKVKHAKMKNRKIKKKVNDELKKYTDVKDTQSTNNIADFIAKSEEGLLIPNIVQNGIKKNSAPVLRKTRSETKKRKHNSEINKDSNKRFRRNSGIWEVQELDISTFKLSKPASDCQEPETKEETLKPIKNKPDNVITKSINTLKKENSFDEKPVIRNSPRIKSKNITLKETSISDVITSTPKAVLKKRTAVTPASLVKNPFSPAKKVKIALNLNRSQDHREYHRSLVSSPGIPYDADKKPTKPLLKSRISLPATLNPFYKHNA